MKKLAQFISFRNNMILILFLLLSGQLDAQICINESTVTDDYNKLIHEVSYETNLDIDNQLVDILAAIGENQVWNFADLNYVDSTEIFSLITDIPTDDPLRNDPNFSDATFIVKNILPPVQGGLPDTQVFYSYNSLIDGVWLGYGGVSMTDLDFDGVPDTLLQWFSPPLLQSVFPVKYGNQWSDSTSLVNAFNGMEFVSAISLDTCWVEGHGNLMTPSGNFEALRIRNKEVSWVQGSPITDVSNDVDFITEDYRFWCSIVVEDGRAFFNKRTVVDEISPTIEIPSFDFNLHQNFPNPFSDQTTILFTLKEHKKVLVRVLDLNGKLISVLAQRNFNAGEHKLIWSASNSPAGVYVLETRVGNQVQQRLMKVVR